MSLEKPLPMPATPVVEVKTKAPAGPKHRACDECRSRKLACTKEPEGCSRCKREGITCHYSPQKPMGRPRKRPRDDSHENSEIVPLSQPAAKTAMAEVPPTTADPGMALIEHLLGEENVFDMSGSLDFMGMTSEQVSIPDFDFATIEHPKHAHSTSFLGWGGGLDTVDFGAPAQDHTFSHSELTFTESLEPSPPAEHVPALSPNASNSSSTPETSAAACSPSDSTQKCACSPNLYLAISTIQNLEKDVTGGVRQARLAMKTAYDVVSCPVCSARIDTIPQMTAAGAIQSFQNLMMLATLIPSIVHAYREILRMVDCEAQRARAERKQLLFTLDGLGGIWGGLNGEGPGPSCCPTDPDTTECFSAQAYNHREMDPTLWRLTVRALLKIDVYGLSHNFMEPSATPGQEPFHLGLRDIVNIMEAKSKARHAYMDVLEARGSAPACIGHLQMNKPGETPQCQQIISIARRSIEALVIP